MTYFVVVRVRGPEWQRSLPMRRQACWEEHAASMDGLEADGFIRAGGPLGDEDAASRVLFVVKAASEAAVAGRLRGDPWTDDMLRTLSIEPWNVLLGGLGA